MPTDRIESMDTQKIANIMSVALEEFAQNSYDKSSYNQIIKKSGMSKGTMYYYFKSKEDLFNTLLSATIKEFKPLSRLKSNQEDELTFWADMWRLCYGCLFLLQQKPSIGNFARNLLCSENRDYESPTSVIYKKVNARLLDCIVSGQMAKAIRTDICPENLIHMCWAVWDASEKVERIDDIEDKTDLIIDFAKRVLEPHKQTSV